MYGRFDADSGDHGESVEATVVQMDAHTGVTREFTMIVSCSFAFDGVEVTVTDQAGTDEAVHVKLLDLTDRAVRYLTAYERGDHDPYLAGMLAIKPDSELVDMLDRVAGDLERAEVSGEATPRVEELRDLALAVNRTLKQRLAKLRKIVNDSRKP